MFRTKEGEAVTLAKDGASNNPVLIRRLVALIEEADERGDSLKGLLKVVQKGTKYICQDQGMESASVQKFPAKLCGKAQVFGFLCYFQFWYFF